MKISIPFFCLFVFFSQLSLLAQERLVETVEITSSWGGLGTPTRSQMTVVRKGANYVANGKTVEASKIDALVKALGEPVLSKPSLDNLGITPASLNGNAQICVADCVNGYVHRANAKQQQLFISKFTDLNVVENEIGDLFRGGWTDDYPDVEAKIQFTDGHVVKVSSDNQPRYMLPWKIIDGSEEKSTFNAHISNALFSLLPVNFTNAKRLSGEGFYESLANSILRVIKPEWNRLEVIEKASGAFNSFEKDYEIVSSEINPYHDSDFGTPWNTGIEPEKNLHLVLRKNDYPKGFALKLILPIDKGDVRNIELFRANIDSYLNLVNSVPWIKSFVDTSGKPVWLRFVKNRSLSEKGLRSFAADMKALGKADLAAEVEKVQDKVVVLSIGGGLEYYQSFWLILPDGRSVVWRHYYVSPLPDIKFVGKDCAENRSNSKPCVGALISRDGKVIAM